MNSGPFCAEPVYALEASGAAREVSQQLSIAPINTTASQSPQLLVQVLVEGPDGSHLTLPVHTTDTIKELRMALSNKSWFTSQHCIFFGNRQLLDHQQVADVVRFPW
jgi:hypothetical protein